MMPMKLYVIHILAESVVLTESALNAWSNRPTNSAYEKTIRPKFFGRIVRHSSHGVAEVRFVTDNKVFRILTKNGLAQSRQQTCRVSHPQTGSLLQEEVVTFRPPSITRVVPPLLLSLKRENTVFVLRLLNFKQNYTNRYYIFL